jgi:rSAM/selenodomain-associated transferase 1
MGWGKARVHRIAARKEAVSDLLHMSAENPASGASDAIAVMARLPVAGRAKTRLIPLLGAEGAAALHAALVTHTLAALAPLGLSGVATTVWVDGPESAAAVAFGSQHRFALQPDGDLGERLRAAVEAAFRDGARRVLAVGTDCPDLEKSHITAAFSALTTSDVVLGPASDGGYYLIGFAREAWPKAADAALREIPWSTDRTLAVTLERLSSAGFSVATLAQLDDLDEPHDVAQQFPAFASR